MKYVDEKGIKRAVSKLLSLISNCATKDVATSKNAGLMSAMDKSNLDFIYDADNQEIYAAAIPDEMREVLEFSGFVTVTVSMIGANNAAIYFNTKTNTFVAKSGSFYCGTWAGAEKWGSQETNGVRPVTGKIYIYGGDMYRWDGKGLTLLNPSLTVDTSLSDTSVNPVQNKVIYNALADKSATSHTHTLSSLGMYVALSSTTTGGWDLIGKDHATGVWIKALKGAVNAPSWYAPRYASGIAFGGGDIKAVISLSNSNPQVRFASGAGTSPQWWLGLRGTKDKEYDLDNIPTGKMAAQAELSSSASLTTVINEVNAIIRALKAAGIMNS
jgi:hypothetical protein|nr:MAG TPA: Head fiber protein [Caudoviricetes sp.]